MSLRVIDAHNHPNWHGIDTDALVRNMDENGIEKTWLLAWEISRTEYDMEPYYHQVMDPRDVSVPLWMIVDGLKKYPDRFIGGWAPDPRYQYARAEVYSAVKLHGIKVFGELKCRMRYDNPDAIAMFRHCAELGLPVLFHLECPEGTLTTESKSMNSWPFWYGGDFSVVENMCRLCPATQFIGHAPGFWRELSGDAAEDPERYPKGPVTPGGRLFDLLRRYENLHCDLSAGSAMTTLNRDLKLTREFFIEFQDRILHGRDDFGRAQMDLLEKLDLGEETMEKILHGNAERLIENAGKGV
ncbi:MAG: amidohydrolase family protein [Candidatus Brocadiae bacterium]|nr:amidohydrolase family protein [Candidatus Brocadiia bacterium]